MNKLIKKLTVYDLDKLTNDRRITDKLVQSFTKLPCFNSNHFNNLLRNYSLSESFRIELISKSTFNKLRLYKSSLVELAKLSSEDACKILIKNKEVDDVVLSALLSNDSLSEEFHAKHTVKHKKFGELALRSLIKNTKISPLFHILFTINHPLLELEDLLCLPKAIC